MHLEVSTLFVYSYTAMPFIASLGFRLHHVSGNWVEVVVVSHSLVAACPSSALGTKMLQIFQEELHVLPHYLVFTLLHIQRTFTTAENFFFGWLFSEAETKLSGDLTFFWNEMQNFVVIRR